MSPLRITVWPNVTAMLTIKAGVSGSKRIKPTNICRPHCRETGHERRWMNLEEVS